ncbi:MAG: hypothetical protein OHK0017_12570 [Patescibacteria group bacterium]
MSVELDNLRQKIQQIDLQILELLGQRQQKTNQVGILKKADGLPILNQEVFNKKLQELIQIGKKAGLSSKFIRKIWRAVHHESIRMQERTNK